MPANNKVTKGSALTVVVAVSVIVAIIVVRLFYLSVFMFDEYQKKVIDQLITENKVSASRGLIYDANMNVLAANYTVYDISVSPSKIAKLTSEEKIADVWNTYYPGVSSSDISGIIADLLASALELDREDVLAKLAKKTSLYANIKKGVESDKAEKIREFIDKLDLHDEIFVNAASQRYYPYDNLASHAIGFAGADNEGLFGIEYQYNDVLSGTDGKYIIARDAYGNEMPFEYESYVEAVDGYSIVSTIDMRVQAVLEKYIKEASETFGTTNGVSGIVMDINTGGILAMATYPDYNLNDPFTLSEYYQKLLDASELEKGSKEYSSKLASLRYDMWKNKSVNTVYMPGSTFKIITVSMTLEEKLATLTESFNCSGFHMVPGYNRPIKCHVTYGHGTLSLRQGLQKSCNPVMMTLAERIGGNLFYDYFENYGYLEKTGIDLPGEETGVFYPRGNFGPVDLACASFGQNFGISMLQHIVAISAAVNGGNLVVPHVVDQIIDSDGNVIKNIDTVVKRQIVSKETSEAICDILAEAAANAQSSTNAYVPGYRVATKTGTTEKTDKRDETGAATLRIGSCVTFAPADDPQYIILIVNDEPRLGSQWGSVNAAPYAGMVLEEILPLLGVEPVYTEEELEELTITVGNYVGRTRASAEKLIAALGCDVEIIGEGEKVTAQTPAKGASFTKGSGKITIYLGAEPDENTYTVPDVVGMNLTSANQTVINAGFNVKISGVKNYGLGSELSVIAQSPAAGTKVKAGTVVTITSVNPDIQE